MTSSPYVFQTIAKKMGLDVSSNSTLWKDKAVVEANVAVMHSFQVGGSLKSHLIQISVKKTALAKKSRSVQYIDYVFDEMLMNYELLGS